MGTRIAMLVSRCGKVDTCLKRHGTCQKERMFALDRKDKAPNSFCTKRSALFMRHVQHMIVMQSPAGSAGDPARLSGSIRITAKTTIKTV
ncbi:hypothetical protein QE369_000817 [Agrobacterium larrymoorei]|uniref:Uncharacterized protein n=3 Tax=Agrobacterium larrymoorei TaxID=160699 RepID=A0AAJ2BCZ5_9HYPH|nr:hypothetical protein [Agrobacterium larrymoorei]